MDAAVVRILSAIVAVAALAACGSSSLPAVTSSPTPSTVTPATVTPSTLTPTTGAPSVTSSPTVNQLLVSTAHWTQTSAGFRLHVRPSANGREHAAGHASSALNQALRAAGPRPLALTPSIRRSLTNQLKCHAVFAAEKPWWDLETWRPDVGFTATVLAACNP